MMRSLDEGTAAATRVVDAAALLGERARRSSASSRSRRCTAAASPKARRRSPTAASRIAQLAREQLESGRAIVEIVGRLANDTQVLTRGQKDLRRHIDRIHGGAAQIAGLENEVTARLAAVNDAAVQAARGAGPAAVRSVNRLLAAAAGARLPAALVDLAGFDANVDHFVAVARRGRKRLRVATKSIRVPALLERVRDRAGDAFGGLMTFTAAETAWLAGLGWRDLLLAYPTAAPGDAALLAGTARARRRRRSGAARGPGRGRGRGRNHHPRRRRARPGVPAARASPRRAAEPAPRRRRRRRARRARRRRRRASPSTASWATRRRSPGSPIGPRCGR